MSRTVQEDPATHLNRVTRAEGSILVLIFRIHVLVAGISAKCFAGP
jgi:hypothetical protein